MKTEGLTGRAVALVMAKYNADMEQAAIDRLAPLAHHHVLEIGFGPGVGIELLAQRLTDGHVAGADPSQGMVEASTRRNRHDIEASRVELARAWCHDLPWPDNRFDGIIAVNCAQVFEPPLDSYREIYRVLRPAARLVTLTHDWAVKRHSSSVGEWLDSVRDACDASGFLDMQHWAGKARSGGTIGFTAIAPAGK